MVWTLEIAPGVNRDLDRIDPAQRRRIIKFLRDRLVPLESPRDIGEALRGPIWAGYWKYRVGDYRVICYIEDARKCIQVTRVRHRRDAYR
ncbi:MAG: type II toxin-antitoxin system RelE/ParE family toxin [Gammaproteobacteria bacterium]|nr:type II toxin-antitoxin system RelE/ParE family toxin [Gammaproteobacteria bacterium]MYD79219.1 type II toxin-antitoxin system RelE/ParE family toxin [Gammaproteobacteria bacterium]